MAYEYLLDTYGKSRGNKKTRYIPIEKKAIQWMIDFVEKRRSGMDFAKEFNEILEEYTTLFREIGHFEEDTPLWLNTLGGLHFLQWYQLQQIYWYLHNHYDELTENQLKNYEQIKKMDNAKTQQRYAQNAWDNFRTQLRYAKEADEKAAMYLRWSAGK